MSFDLFVNKNCPSLELSNNYEGEKCLMGIIFNRAIEIITDIRHTLNYDIQEKYKEHEDFRLDVIILIYEENFQLSFNNAILHEWRVDSPVAPKTKKYDKTISGLYKAQSELEELIETVTKEECSKIFMDKEGDDLFIIP